MRLVAMQGMVLMVPMVLAEKRIGLIILQDEVAQEDRVAVVQERG